MAGRYPEKNENILLVPGSSSIEDEDVNVFNSNTDLREHPMLRGMKGYQLTPEDLEFLKTMLEEKIVSDLKKQLEEAQRLLQLETIAAAKALANRQAQEVLEKLPRWVKLVWGSNLAEVDGLDAEGLLNLVSSLEVSRVLKKKKVHLEHMRETLENKRKKNAEEEMQLQKLFVCEQSKVQLLMTELSDLKSQLIQQELAYETLRKGSQVTNRIKREEVDVPEEKQQGTTECRHRSRRKEGQKPESMAGLTQGRKYKSTSAQQCPATHRDRDRKKISGVSCRTSSTSKSAAGKSARENEEVTTGKLKQPTRKPKTVVVTAVSPQGGSEEPHHAGLRRSKRIANKKLPSPGPAPSR